MFRLNWLTSNHRYQGLIAICVYYCSDVASGVGGIVGTYHVARFWILDPATAPVVSVRGLHIERRKTMLINQETIWTYTEEMMT